MRKPQGRRLPVVRVRAAGFIIQHPRTKRFLILLKRRTKTWEFPKGKIQAGEGTLAAAQREIAEEIGWPKIRPMPGFRRTVSYRFRIPGALVKKTVIFFLSLRSGRIRLSAEHQAFRWVRPDTGLRLFRHRNYRQLLEEVWRINPARKRLSRRQKP